MHFVSITTLVIPGQPEGLSPESIFTAEQMLNGFRAPSESAVSDLDKRLAERR